MSEELLPCPFCGAEAMPGTDDDGKLLGVCSGKQSVCLCSDIGVWNANAAHANELRQRADRAEAEVESWRHKAGSLALERDLLQRQAADDALLIHTYEEIIERTKKDLGQYRESFFDLKKENERLSEENARLRALVAAVGEWSRRADLDDSKENILDPGGDIWPMYRVAFWSALDDCRKEMEKWK